MSFAFLVAATGVPVQMRVASEETKHMKEVGDVTIVEAGRFRDLDICHLSTMASSAKSIQRSPNIFQRQLMLAGDPKQLDSIKSIPRTVS